MDDLRSAAAAAAQEHSQSARDGPPLLDQDQARIQAGQAEEIVVALSVAVRYNVTISKITMIREQKNEIMILFINPCPIRWTPYKGNHCPGYHYDVTNGIPSLLIDIDRATVQTLSRTSRRTLACCPLRIVWPSSAF